MALNWRLGLSKRATSGQMGQRGVISALSALLLVAGIGLLASPGSADPGAAQWKASQLVMPAGAGPSPDPKINTTECPAVRRCVMVGRFFLADGHREGLIETLASSQLTGITAPLPSGAATNPGAELNDVSCPSPTSCAAAGFYTDSEGRGQAVLEALSHGSWSSVQAPLPADAATDNPAVNAFGISCVRPGTCVEVGNYFTAQKAQHGLIETLAGGQWTPLVMPLPSDAAPNPQATPEPIVCTAASRCVVLGFYRNNSGGQVPFADTLSRGAWTSTALPLPTGANSTDPRTLPRSLSCPITGSCVGVGRYLDHDGHFQGLTELQNGANWSAVEAPLPDGAASDPDVFLQSVSCPVVGRCTAVSPFTQSAGNTRGVLEQLSGGQWTPLLTPRPEGDNTNNFPDSVACGQPDVCAAAGSTNINGLLLTLRQGVMQAVVAPLPAELGFPAPDFEPKSLACPSPSWCAAGGSFTTTLPSAKNVRLGVLEVLSRGG
jgi:hypothetical protein